MMLLHVSGILQQRKLDSYIITIQSKTYESIKGILLPPPAEWVLAMVTSETRPSTPAELRKRKFESMSVMKVRSKRWILECGVE